MFVCAKVRCSKAAGLSGLQCSAAHLPRAPAATLRRCRQLFLLSLISRILKSVNRFSKNMKFLVGEKRAESALTSGPLYQLWSLLFCRRRSRRLFLFRRLETLDRKHAFAVDTDRMFHYPRVCHQGFPCPAVFIHNQIAGRAQGAAP